MSGMWDRVVHPSPFTAAAATVWALGVPTATFLWLLMAAAPTLVATGVAVTSSLAAMATGTLWWRNRPQSRILPFTELMMWTWLRRARALRKLDHGLELLKGKSPEEQLEVLRELSLALERKDPHTHGHSRRVEQHVIRTALELGHDEHLEDLKHAAVLHDVGKIKLPDSILNKEAPLTARERSIVNQHVVVGARLVANTGNRRISEAVLHHHEQWDGNGYPRGLSGEAIPLFARIITVVDAFDAMMSTRCYRSSLGRKRAVEILKAESWRQFDPNVVDAFLRKLPERMPVAVFLPLSAIFRRGRRLHFASEVAAICAVVGAFLVGASMLSSPNDPGRPPVSESTPNAYDTEPPIAPTLKLPATNEANRPSGRRPGGATTASTKPRVSGPDRVAALPQEESGAAGNTTPVETGGTGGIDPPQPTPEPTPPPEPPPSPDPETTPDSPTKDPKPAKGKDCEKPPPSPGNDKHCG
jgi:HD-GYP domain-containing protein (c-di-GMP phosphodiesterase class II)